MTTTARQPLSLRVWNRAVWPVLAGFVGLVGLVGAATVGSRAAWLSALVTIALFAGVMTWSVVPGSFGRAVKVAVATPVAVTVLVGWLVLSPSLGLVLLVMVSLLSPPVLEAALARRRRSQERQAVVIQPPQRMVLDREMVDRRFAEIAHELQDLDRELDS